MIEVEHLCTRFGRAVVHDDITLAVERGEVFGIAGGNGCGKSTLLREMLMLHRPTSGTIRVFGHDLAALSRREARQLNHRWGVMFQHGALFSSMTVAENVAAPLREHADLSRGLIEEIVGVKLGLTGFPLASASKFPNELSGGMRRRAALARALALDPELLFLDEPTAGLDPVGAAEFDELVEELRTLLGLTIVMVTHDLDSLWRVADRVAVLGEGRVLGEGTMRELSASQDARIRAFFCGPRGRAAKEQSWSDESTSS